MKLAIFDLDNTLIGGDSDYLWGQFLCEHGYLDEDTHSSRHQQYYEDYKAGNLDIMEFLEFQLQPLAGVEPVTLEQRRAQYLEEKILPIMLDKAQKLVDRHRQQGHCLLIITATNEFITLPIAKMLGVKNLIASNAEKVNGYYTGKPVGTPSYAAGKVTRLQAWLEEHNSKPEETWFYSDSHNDIPLLEIVDHPVAVDPDEILKKTATENGWPIISLR
ncbi:MAG TPA: HAD family hydrolase [Gammaproteobacteria bacterium]|nr:HAD family hydrolase [Gammaproteobacteria bacterium]